MSDGPIHHVGLEVAAAQVAAVTAFWELLGWHRVPLPPTIDEAGAWLQRGEQQIHLLVVEPAGVPHEGHVAVVDVQLDQTAARLAAAGFETSERRQHWGARRIFTRCPAGHRVELMAFPPGTPQPADGAPPPAAEPS